MARARKKTGTPQTYPNGMTKKQMKRKKPIDSSYMTEVKPLTENQKLPSHSTARVKTYCYMVQQVQVKLLLHCILL